MAWDTWALLSILSLCLATICWSAWGFYRDSRRSGDARFLRLAYVDGSRYMEVPASGGVGRRHRAQHRAA